MVWSTNQDRNMHPQERAREIKQWKAAIMYGFRSCFVENREQPPSIIQVTLPFATQRRRDPHNYCGTVMKAIIDGLVMGGAWPDDTPDYIGHREPILYKGRVVYVKWTPFDAGDRRLL